MRPHWCRGHAVVTRWSRGGHAVVTWWSRGSHVVVTWWSRGHTSALTPHPSTLYQEGDTGTAAMVEWFGEGLAECVHWRCGPPSTLKFVHDFDVNNRQDEIPIDLNGQNAARERAGDLIQNWSRNPQYSTLNPQPSILNPQPSILNPQLSTLNPQPSTLDSQPSTLNLQPWAGMAQRRASRSKEGVGGGSGGGRAGGNCSRVPE